MFRSPATLFRYTVIRFLLVGLVTWLILPDPTFLIVTHADVRVAADTAIQDFRLADENTHCVRVEGTRVRINAGDNNAYRMQFAEIEIYVHNPTGDRRSTFNIATGATVLASSSFEYVGWSTEKVNDGEWDSVPGA